MKQFIKLFFLSLCLIQPVFSNTEIKINKNNCPTKMVNGVSQKIIDLFRQKRSLLAVKRFLSEDVLNKNYLKDYKIYFDQKNDYVIAHFTCPKILAKFLFISEKRDNQFIVTEDGQYYDPRYEDLLLSENIIQSVYPFVTVYLDGLNENLKSLLMTSTGHNVDLFKMILGKVKDLKNLSEVILKDNQLIIIMKAKSRTQYVFLDEFDPIFYNQLLKTDEVNDPDKFFSFYFKQTLTPKLEKLNRILDFFSQAKQAPRAINLENDKKIVVKF